MRVVVCGGRGFKDRDFIFRHLSRLDKERGPIVEVMEGGAPGTDKIAGEWADENGRRHVRDEAAWEDLAVPGAVRAVRADGTEYNVLAGFQRNQRMADSRLDLVIVFPGGRGTADMARRARCAGVNTIHIVQTTDY